MSDVMSITDMLARLRDDAADERFEGARLGPTAVRELLRHVDALRRERDELAARLAEIEQAEPVQGPTWLADEQIAQITAQTWGSVDIAPQSAAAFARAIEAWMLRPPGHGCRAGAGRA